MKPLLYGSPGSHHSRRVLVLVAELGIDVDMKTVDVRPPGMGGDNSEPEFFALNPNGKVPVLRDGDMVLWESNAIMWYLAERHGDTPLWPRDAAKRAQIAKWQLWQGAHLSPAADGLLYEHVVKPMMKKDPDPAACERLLASFDRWAGVLDATLAQAEWLANSTFTCADIAVASALMYGEAARLPIQDHPRVAAWLARVHARPSWKATEPRR
jgi:glutathione S-transferase